MSQQATASNAELLNTLRKLEQTLHQSDIRHSADALDQLLHDEFMEIGRSGAIYTKPDIIASLTTATTPTTIWSGHYQLYQISQQTAQLIYQTARVDKDGRKSRWTWRSSMWVKHQETWQLRFHQGTAVDSPKSTTN